jgi:hypothetical protein
MNYADRVIHAKLLMDPESMYINPDGTELYLLVPGGMMCLTGPDFNSMSEAEVNEFIQLVFKK